MAKFTVTADAGKERDTIAFADGGTSTTGLTLHVDAAKFTSKQLLIHALERLINRLNESPWPPVDPA